MAKGIYDPTSTKLSGSIPDGLNEIINKLIEAATLLNSVATTLSGSGLATEATLTTRATEATLQSVDNKLGTIDADTSILAALSKNAGAVDDNTLRIVLETLSRTDLSNAALFLGREAWAKIAGNSVEFTWQVAATKPFRVATATYKQGASTVVTQTFAYDTNDNVTSITAS